MYFGSRSFAFVGELDGRGEEISSPLMHVSSGSSSNSTESISMDVVSAAAPPATEGGGGEESTISSVFSRESPFRGCSPTPNMLEEEEEVVADPNGVQSSTFVPSIGTCPLRHRTSETGERSLETADRSSTTNRSHSPSATNPLRSMNPVFSLSPRTASSSGFLHVPPSTPNVIIHMDKEGAQVERAYAVGTLEGRRNFVLECLHLTGGMSTWGILKELVPALLLVASYDDSACAIARLLPAVVKQIDDLNEDVFVYFMGLIMNMCCSADHEVLRQIATSLEELMPHLSDGISEALLLPLIMTMQTSFWSSPRAVAAALLGVFASRPNLVKASGMTVMNWFNSYVKLAKDKSHFVREVAISSLHQWVSVSQAHQVNFAEMPLPLIHMCMSEEQSDAVRLMQVAELVHFAEMIGKEETTKYLQLPFITASRDASWRVRYVAAKHLGAFASLCMHPGDLLDVFVALCADDMKETRAVAVEQLQFFTSQNVSHEVLCKMSLVAASLAKDKEPIVRQRVAKLLHALLSPGIAAVYTPERRQALFSLLTDEEYIVGCNATRNLEKVVASLARYLRSTVDVGTAFSTTTTASSSAAAAASGLIGSDAFATARETREKHHEVHWDISHSDWPTAGTSTTSLASRSASMEAKTKSITATATATTSLSSSSETTTTTREGATIVENGCLDAEQRVCAAEVLSAIIDRLHVVSESRNWRIREAVVDVFRHFCVALTEEEFIPLTYIIRSMLRDPVSVVRRRAVETLSVVAKSYGSEWAAVMAFDLLQKEFSLGAGTSFTWRVVAIHCLSGILPVVCGLSSMDLRRQELMQHWMRLVTALSEDRVSNVRLALAKSIAAHWEWYSGCCNHKNVIRRCVEQLQRDGDVDVSRVVCKLDATAMGGDSEPF